MTVEIPLEGGRVTPGVVRVGETVRRPQNPNSEFVHELLLHLESVGFDAAPRFVGIDEQGREILSFREGDVPDNIRPDYSDDVLAAAARLLRSFHDATRGWRGADVVCHNDYSPVNAVFEDGLPVSVIDFDIAAPGSPLDELPYSLFLWLDLGFDGQPLAAQARRTWVFFDAYGLGVPENLVDLIVAQQRATAVRAEPRMADAAVWWRGQADWLERYRAVFEDALG
jgi:aminoglycoside phosphotransferase (APT) family kinase protein